jgi:dolichol-phosphate mannosyltransferase
MRLSEARTISAQAAKVSLILPIAAGSRPSPQAVADFRGILGNSADGGPVEVIIAGTRAHLARQGEPAGGWLNDAETPPPVDVFADRAEWSELIHAGLSAATGDHVVVLDVSRQYTVESVAHVVAPIRAGRFDVAIAIPRREGSGLVGRAHPRNAFGLVSRLFLGTKDVFSGLFAFRRSLWEGGRRGHGRPSSLILGSMLRRGARYVDVPVDVHDGFRSERLGLADLRPLKHLLDARFGDYSRLVQFCIVGASGMVVDLSFYAFFQWLLSFTRLATRASAFFGCSWHLAIAAALAISIALVWNFTLNRRLTFNDARKGAIFTQFLKYVLLSNGLSVALSFSVRLYLPVHVGFFARHRLAAAVVGIVAATGISFSMSRWIVFARHPELKRTVHVVREDRVSQTSAVP